MILKKITLLINLILFTSGLLVLKEATAQEKAMLPGQLQKLVPDNINGYNHDEEVKGKLMQIGNLQYSFCEHRFSKKNQNIKVLLFDYKEAPVMFNQVTKGWNAYEPVDSDSIILRSVIQPHVAGWESYQRASNSSQVKLTINSRFFLNIAGENVDLEVLKEVLSHFDFEKFPK